MKVVTSRHPGVRPVCWSCWRVVEGQADAEGSSAKPKDNGLSICYHCAAVGIFEQGKLRPLTKEEREFAETTESWAIVRYVVEQIKARIAREGVQNG